MNILLDNIIFSLQKAGGASVVWQQHLKRLIEDKEFKSQFLEFDNAELNFFRKQLAINKDSIELKSSQFLFLKRYFNLQSKNSEKYLFHSSCYRIDNDEKAINVTTVHDFTYEYFMKGIRQKVHSWQKNNSIIKSKGVICISESTKRDLLKFIPNIDPKRVKVIYNGVDDAFKPLDPSIVLNEELRFEKFSYVLYVGDRSTAYKNFNLAVEVCSIAKIPLLMIGGGTLKKEEILILATKLGKGNFNCRINVANEDLNYYYNNALCLLYPSLYEGFGIPVIEAQKAGCPVIANNGSSIPEVIANPSLMINTNDFDKVVGLINNLKYSSTLRDETIEMGFEKSRKFSWQKTYNETTQYYKELYGND